MIKEKLKQKSYIAISIFNEYITEYMLYTIGKNIIATPKIRNNYGAIQSFIFPILHPFWYKFFASFLIALNLKLLLLQLLQQQQLSILKAIAKRLPLLFANAFKSCHNSWQIDNYVGSNTEKKPCMNQTTKLKVKLKQRD